MADKKGKILLIEDNPDHVELMTLALEDYQVDVCSGDGSCFEKLGPGVYDLILVDYSLPGTNGLEVLEKIKGQGINTPVIFITGQGDERIAAMAIKAGAKDYIVKSRDTLNDLPRIVGQHLGDPSDPALASIKGKANNNHTAVMHQIQEGCRFISEKMESYFEMVKEVAETELVDQVDMLIEHIEKAKAKLENLKGKLNKEK
jgi:DNA-binding NtrC family response regulator